MQAINDAYLAEFDWELAFWYFPYVCFGIAVVVAFWDRMYRELATPFLRVLVVGAIIFPTLPLIITERDRLRYGELRTHYMVYVDGNEVDYNKVNLRRYSLTFDDDAHSIIATSRQ